MSVLKNYSYNLLYQITLIILPIISIPYITRVIGSQGIGIYSYTNSIVQYFILFANLGLSLYASREIAYVKHDIEKRSKLFAEIIAIQFFVTLIILISYFFFIFYFLNEYYYLYLIQSISILSVAFDISWFYIGIENFKKNVLRNIAVKFTTFILLFLIIKSHEDLWKYIMLLVFSLFLGQLFMWVGITKYINKIPFKNLNIKKHIYHSRFFFLIFSIGVLGINLNKTLIGLLVNISELGKYEMAYRLITMSLVIVTSLGSVMTPRISATFKDGNNNKIKEYLSSSLQFTLFFCFLVIPLIIVVSPNFVHWFLGNKFLGAELYLILLSPMILLNSLSNLLATQYMIPSGNERKYFYSLIFGCIIGIISSFYLISKLSVLGACISVLIGEFAILLAHIFQTREQKILYNILGDGWQYILACLPATLIAIVLTLLIKIPILLTFFQLTSSIIIYLVVLFLLKNVFLHTILDKVKSMLFNKLNL